MERDAISKLLVNHGLQVTSQRLDIAEFVLSKPQHLSADQILAAMRERGSRVSKATVYNTMNLFSEQGLVRTVEVDPERVYYDSTSEPHHHFYNVDTGELTDIPAEGVQLHVDASLPEGTVREGVDVVIRVRSAVH
ncbi:MAG: Fur family transcriptional regulator [Gammaproteobacteria bacterium]|nr:Fur family transcriptional regulator [Gammaproteobacteria bacterium]